MEADASRNLEINEKFDFIVLADVIEHIPTEQYDILFTNLNRVSKNDTKIFINIPHPHLIKHIKRTNPESLQSVDQSIYPNTLYQFLQTNQFIIDEKKDYSVFYRTPDYTYYWISPFSIDINSSYDKTIFLPKRILKKLLLGYFHHFKMNILYISSGNPTFVRKDISLLSLKYNVGTLNYEWNQINLPLNIIISNSFTSHYELKKLIQ
jgi:hypothetical protein